MRTVIRSLFTLVQTKLIGVKNFVSVIIYSCLVALTAWMQYSLSSVPCNGV